MQQKTVLVTGGLGYIGSHTVVELIEEGFTVIIVDNLSNSELFILERIKKITGISPLFFQKNVCDINDIQEIFTSHKIDVVIHFAAFKSVGESVNEPLKYFENNLTSLMSVLHAMQQNNVSNLIFSSSATVYGQPEVLPATEQTPFQKALSAYGSTKQIGEEILEKVCASGKVNNISLRYFNPVGAHNSALIGELPKGIPNNLFPYVMQTASGKQQQLTVFGDDYNTPDGSCKYANDLFIGNYTGKLTCNNALIQQFIANQQLDIIIEEIPGETNKVKLSLGLQIPGLESPVGTIDGKKLTYKSAEQTLTIPINGSPTTVIISNSGELISGDDPNKLTGSISLKIQIGILPIEDTCTLEATRK